jgi:hypothetical protein
VELSECVSETNCVQWKELGQSSRRRNMKLKRVEEFRKGACKVERLCKVKESRRVYKIEESMQSRRRHIESGGAKPKKAYKLKDDTRE